MEAGHGSGRTTAPHRLMMDPGKSVNLWARRIPLLIADRRTQVVLVPDWKQQKKQGIQQ
jgi:hypothetical protein